MSQSKLSSPSPYKKLLLVTAQRIGDALFCTPGIRMLKQHLPEVEFDILAFSKEAAQVFANNPDVNTINIFTNKSKIRDLAANYPFVINLMFEMNKYLEGILDHTVSIAKPDMTRHRAEQVIEFVQSLLQKSQSTLERRYFLYPQTQNLTQVKNLLAVENQNQNPPNPPFSKGGKKYFLPFLKGRKESSSLLKKRGKESSPTLEREENFPPLKKGGWGDLTLIGIQLGCHRVDRRGWKFWDRNRHQHKKVWPLQNYTALAKKLIATYPQIRLVLTGSRGEKFLAKRFCKEVPNTLNLVSKTSLLELAALCDLLKVLVTHDTGTLHIACARNTPLIGLYGPTLVEFTGPYPTTSSLNTIIKKPSMEDITVEEVYKAVLEKIEI